MSSHSILIIGCGSIGERHLRCFQRTGRAKVTACDTNPVLLETIARNYHVSTSRSWEESLSSNAFDGAVICAPAHLHIPIALRLLHSKLHVLIEKPLSQSLDGVEQLMAIHRSSGRQVAVAYTLQVYPLLIQVRDFLKSGALGAVLHVTANSGQHFPAMRPQHAVKYSQTYYRDRKTGGGAIQDALTHIANWIESVIGPTESVLCDCAHLALPDVTVEDTVNLSARHGIALVSYSLNQFQAPNESTIQLNTAVGSVRIELHNSRWGIFRLGDTAWNWRQSTPLDRDAPFLAQAEGFLDQIEGKPATLCTLEAARQTLCFNLAALASAEAGARVHCSDIRGDKS